MRTETHSSLIGLGFILIVFVTIFVGCDVFSNFTDIEHVERAKEFRDKGEMRSTKIELKSALKKNPKNSEARWLLGLVNLEFGDSAAAEKELRRAMQLGVANQAILEPLGKSLLLQGKFQELLDEVDAEEGMDPHDQAIVIAYRGDAWMGNKKSEKAEAEYQRALAVDPQAALAKLGQARIAVSKKDYEMAINLLDEALKISPQEPSAWSYQGRMYSEMGELDKAEDNFSNAIQYGRNNRDDRLKRALIRIRRKDYVGAQEDIDILEDHFSGHHLTHYANGLLSFQQQKYPEAQVSLEKSQSLYGNHFPTVYFLGVSYLMQKNYIQADLQLSRFLRANPWSIKGHQMLGLVRYQTQKFREAKELIEPVLTNKPEDIFSLRLISNIEFSLGNPDQGLEYLEKMMDLQPDSPDSYARLGLGKIIAGKKDEGLQELGKALELNPEMPGAEVIMATTYLKSKEYEKARAVIERMREKQPDSPVPLNLLGMLHLDMNEVEKAQSVFRDILTNSPGNPSASHNLAKVLVVEKQFAEARAVYDGVLKVDPEHLSTKLKLAELDAIEGNTSAMRDRLSQVIIDHPDAIAPRLILGRYYLRYGQPERTQTLLEKVAQRNANNPDFLYLMTKAQLADGQPARARETALRLVRLDPESAVNHFMLSKIYAANNDKRKMKAALRKSLKIDPKFLPARLAMVKMLMFEKETETAKSTLKTLLQQHPENPNVMSLDGWLALQLNEPKRAVVAYEKALNRFPSTDLAIKVAKAQWASGETDKAFATLGDWSDKYPKDSKVDYLRAGLYTTLGKEEDARKQLEKVVKANPKNVLALNDLAWILRKKDPNKALEYAGRAMELAPKAIPIVDTFAMILVEKSRYDRAFSLMRKVISKAPDNLTFQYHLAILQEASGEKQNAFATLKTIFASKKDFPERAEAEVLLKKMGASLGNQ